jgi:hypothetical protein
MKKRILMNADECERLEKNAGAQCFEFIIIHELILVGYRNFGRLQN